MEAKNQLIMDIVKNQNSSFRVNFRMNLLKVRSSEKSEELQNKTVLQKEQSTGECGVDLKNQELTIQVWQQRKSEKLSYQTVLSSDVDKDRWYRWLHLLTFPQ